MAMIDRNFTFATNGTVTANDLHNLIDSATIYQDLITGQVPITSVGTNYELLIADATNPNAAPNAVTVYDLFDDALSVGTYTGLNLTGALTYGTATGTRLVSANATITTGTITTGVIPTLTSSTATFGTTTSTAATITSGTITSGTITNLASTTGTIATLNSTTGTIATLNSTTGTIPTLVATTLITTGAGTAAAPAIVPTGDTNTGIFFPAADTIAFAEGGTEGMRIDSSGNVGIGTASPQGTLTVKNSTDNAFILLGNNASLGASLGTIKAAYSGDITTYKVAASIDFIRNESADGRGGDIYFQTNAQGGAGATTKMIVNGAGNVGIGTVSPSAQLELSTDSAKKPSTNTWTIASDQRLKTNITNADNDRCYEIVKQVPLKRYTWKSEVYSQEQVKDRSKLGWIAQDVEAVFPKAVGTNRFAYNQVFEDVVTPELDSDGNAVLNENGVVKTKTEKRLVSEDVIEDCKDLNSDQIYAAMYGTIQKLIEKVELLESKVATLEAA